MSELKYDAAQSLQLPLKADEIVRDPLLDGIIHQIERSHANVERTCYDGVWHAAQAGEYLHFVKERISHGGWKPWLSESLPAISVRTCERYMEVARILRHLPGYPLNEPGVEPSKTTRASQLSVIRANGLTSLRKVLLLNQNSKQDSAEQGASLDGTIADELVPPPFRLDDDWQTPAEIVACTIELFGAIDLDTCGVTDPQFHLSATRTLTKADDGLSPVVPWHGRVFVHPPVTNVGPFVERAVAAVAGREAEEALLFLPAETDAAHMAVLQPFVKGFLHCRPTFATPSGELVQPATPYMLVWISNNEDRQTDFAEAFGHVADTYYPHRF